MIDHFISAIATVIGWLVGVIADLAYFFGRVASYASNIPLVGGSLKSFFTSIQSAFNDFGDDLASFGTVIQNVLNVIDNWLDDLVDLTNDVHGWIMDRIDYAYTRARNAWDWISDRGKELYSDVYGWISDNLADAYASASYALDWVADTGQDIFNDVYGWISDNLADAYASASDALDWIANFPAHISEFLEPLRDEILQSIGPIFNLVDNFFDDINLFFSDPPAYFQKKLTELGKSFADGFWAFIEAVLERIW